MRGKIFFALGLGVGYLLGTRAGREKYEQISKISSALWHTQLVQNRIRSLKDCAKKKYRRASVNIHAKTHEQ